MLTKRKAVELFDGSPQATAIFMGISVTGLYRMDDDDELPAKHAAEFVTAFPAHFPGAAQAARAEIAKRWRHADAFARRTGHRPEVPDGLTEAERLGDADQ